MCVICYIPKGVETPSKTMLTAMYKANPHGIGFCTPKTLYKGMNFDLFYKRIQQRRIEEPCLLHFRLATHGSVKRANCHPFYDKCTDTYFMHNGILNIRPMGDMTDSETAYRGILVPYIKRYGIGSRETKEVINQIIDGSKFAFMQGYHVMLFGEYYKHDEVYYSNMRFRRYLPF